MLRLPPRSTLPATLCPYTALFRSLEHLHGELGIAVLDLRAGREGAVGQQAHAVALHTEAGTEAEAALGHRHRRAPQDRRPRVSHLRGAPARPDRKSGV